MNKFENLLKQTNSGIKGVRVSIITEDVKFAVEDIVRKEEVALRELKKKKVSMTDIFPSSALSTLAIKEDFDANSWAKNLLELNIEIALQEIRVEEAQKIQTEWFSEEESKEESHA